MSWKSVDYISKEWGDCVTKNDVIDKINETIKKIVDSINTGLYENAADGSDELTTYIEDLIDFDEDNTEPVIDKFGVN